MDAVICFSPSTRSHACLVNMSLEKKPSLFRTLINNKNDQKQQALVFPLAFLCLLPSSCSRSLSRSDHFADYLQLDNCTNYVKKFETYSAYVLKGPSHTPPVTVHSEFISSWLNIPSGPKSTNVLSLQQRVHAHICISVHTLHSTGRRNRLRNKQSHICLLRSRCVSSF